MKSTHSLSYIFIPKSKSELYDAIDLWCSNKNTAYKLYNHISTWNTEYITDMSGIFSNKINFNDENVPSLAHFPSYRNHWHTHA